MYVLITRKNHTEQIILTSHNHSKLSVGSTACCCTNICIIMKLSTANIKILEYACVNLGHLKFGLNSLLRLCSPSNLFGVQSIKCIKGGGAISFFLASSKSLLVLFLIFKLAILPKNIK